VNGCSPCGSALDPAFVPIGPELANLARQSLRSKTVYEPRPSRKRTCTPHRRIALDRENPRDGHRAALFRASQDWFVRSAPLRMSIVVLAMPFPAKLGEIDGGASSHTAFRLRAPVSVLTGPRRPGGLLVLGPVASRRAWAPRLRRVAEPLASHVTRRGTFPFRRPGRRPEGNFRSSITPPADALFSTSGAASRRRLEDSG